MAYYTLVIDYGIPYELKPINEQALINELTELKDQLKRIGEVPHLDITIYDEQDEDITNKYHKILEQIK